MPGVFITGGALDLLIDNDRNVAIMPWLHRLLQRPNTRVKG
jgi:hypothetical protein